MPDAYPSGFLVLRLYEFSLSSSQGQGAATQFSFVWTSSPRWCTSAWLLSKLMQRRLSTCIWNMYSNITAFQMILSPTRVPNLYPNSSWASLNFATFTATNPPHSTRSPMTRRNVLIRSWSNTYKSSVTISKATGWTFSLWPSSHTTMPNTPPPACLHSLQTMAYTLTALSK